MFALQLIKELKSKSYNIYDVPNDVLEKAINNGYQLINNHLMAYVDNTKTWCIDYWFGYDSLPNEEKCGYCNGDGFNYDRTIDKDISCKYCHGTGIK